MQLLRIILAIPKRLGLCVTRYVSQSSSSPVAPKCLLGEAVAASPLDALDGDNATLEPRAKHLRQTAPEEATLMTRPCVHLRSVHLAECTPDRAELALKQDMNKPGIAVAVLCTSLQSAKFAKQPAELNKLKLVHSKMCRGSSPQASFAKPTNCARMSSCASPTPCISHVTTYKSMPSSTSALFVTASLLTGLFLGG